MKLREFRALLKSAGKEAAPDAAVERKWTITSEMHARSITLLNTPDQPSVFHVDVSLLEFLNQDPSFYQKMQSSMALAGWPPGVEVRISRDHDIRRGQFMYGLQAKAPDVPDAPSGGEAHLQVFPAKLSLQGVRVSIPCPAVGPFTPRTRALSSGLVAYLQQAIQCFGWPVHTFIHCNSLGKPQTPKSATHVPVHLYTWVDADSTTVVEAAGIFQFDSQAQGMPTYPRSRLEVSVEQLRVLGVDWGDL